MNRPKWRDSDGNSSSETHSQRGHRLGVTEATLRREVMRDLESLMNSISLDSAADLSDFPAVEKSIINYGFPDIARRTLDELDTKGLETEIEKVLCSYEPRLERSSLRIARDKRLDPVELNVRYVVHAELLCEPLKVPVEFVADVEVTTGKIHISAL